MAIDPLFPQMVRDIARDVQSQAAFLFAYAMSANQQPLNLDAFRTLPSFATIGAGTNGMIFFGTGVSTTGSKLPAGRLTNLTSLNIDTTFFARNRSMLNPDVSAGLITPVTFMPLTLLNGQPVTSGNFTQTAASNRLFTPMGIAQSEVLFGSELEQQEGSMLLALSQNVTSPELAFLLESMMPVRFMHFTGLQTTLVRTIVNANQCSAAQVTPPGLSISSGNACFNPPPPSTNPESFPVAVFTPFQAPNGGLFFNNLNNAGLGPESIFPSPTTFKSGLPPVSIVRPGGIQTAGASLSLAALTRTGVFQGQSGTLTSQLTSLAQAADLAARQCQVSVITGQ